MAAGGIKIVRNGDGHDYIQVSNVLKGVAGILGSLIMIAVPALVIESIHLAVIQRQLDDHIVASDKAHAALFTAIEHTNAQQDTEETKIDNIKDALIKAHEDCISGKCK
jgi:hypothetical protein